MSIHKKVPRTIDPKAEADLENDIAAIDHRSMMELRSTLRAGYDAKGLGYKSLEDARLTIITINQKQVDKRLADHLRKYPL